MVPCPGQPMSSLQGQDAPPQPTHSVAAPEYGDLHGPRRRAPCPCRVCRRAPREGGPGPSCCPWQGWPGNTGSYTDLSLKSLAMGNWVRNVTRSRLSSLD